MKFCTISVIALAMILASLRYSKDAAVAADRVYEGERDSLIQFRDSLSSSVNLHSNWTGPPCYDGRSRWFGIGCSGSRVTSIALEGILLTGWLPPLAFQNVTYLQNLSLANNAIRGELPQLKGLVHLQGVSLARNRFSGSMPMELTELRSLSRLELQENLLEGSIPEFDQPMLSEFNVSYNFLSGRIPDTPVLRRFSSSSFDHNSGLCGAPLETPCPSAPAPPPGPANGGAPPQPPPRGAGARSPELWILVMVAAGALVVPFSVVLCFLCYHKRCRDRAATEEAKKHSGDFEEKNIASASTVAATGIPELDFFDRAKPPFDLEDLLRASAEVMGKGKLGTTYRTTLESGVVVAVKRLKDVSGLSKKEFVQQMHLLGNRRHENLVEMLAFYCSKDEKLLVYEYIPNGSLFHLLHDNRGEGRMPLNWAARLSIVRGIAAALEYLHHSLLPAHKIPHANLKSSNVLILHSNQNTNHYVAKLTDYGFHPLLQHQNLLTKLAIARTPEFTHGRRLTSQADIFCFGLILVEVITGMVPSENEEDLCEWVRAVVTSDWSTDILDLEIVAQDEAHGEMMKLAEIALECTAFDPEKRPVISELVGRIDEIK